MAKAILGLIIPPRRDFLHPDAVYLYGERFDFAVEGLGIDEMAAPDFDAAAARIEDAARSLRRRGAAAIALLGTSLSFFRGRSFNEALERTMRETARCPAVTATSAIVSALAGARCVAVGAAYDNDMNGRLSRYLRGEGFHVPGVAGLDIRKVAEAMATGDETLMELAAKACAVTPEADAILLSCGAFATAHLLPRLEQKHGLRAVSSTPAALHAAVGLLRNA